MLPSTSSRSILDHHDENNQLPNHEQIREIQKSASFTTECLNPALDRGPASRRPASNWPASNRSESARHQTAWGAPQTVDAAERARRPLNLVRRSASVSEAQKRKRRHPDIRMAPRGVCALSERSHGFTTGYAGQVSPSAWPVAASDNVSSNRTQCC